jgi:hypothetical protein
MRPIGLITVVLAVLAGGGLASSAQAATLNVAANGVDGPTCGADATPCRTIGQAVLNADEGDRILVGPGVYGDLNEDDDLADDGEEEAGDPACDCMLQITKRLTFESSAGAAMTIIRGTTTLIAVSLEASGIIFGAHDRGFTISRGQDGLRLLAGAVGVQVIGNVVNGPGAGWDSGSWATLPSSGTTSSATGVMRGSLLTIPGGTPSPATRSCGIVTSVSFWLAPTTGR